MRIYWIKVSDWLAAAGGPALLALNMETNCTTLALCLCVLTAYNVTTARSLSGLAYWHHLRELLLSAPWHPSISGVNSHLSPSLPLSVSLTLSHCFQQSRDWGFTVSKPSALVYRQLGLWTSHYAPLLLCFYLTERSALLHNEQRWNHRKGERYHISHTGVIENANFSISHQLCSLSLRNVTVSGKMLRYREGENNEHVTTLTSCNLQIWTFQNFNQETLICWEKSGKEHKGLQLVSAGDHFKVWRYYPCHSISIGPSIYFSKVNVVYIIWKQQIHITYK